MASFTYTTECSFCLKTFKSFYSLRKHMLTKHHESDVQNVVPAFKDAESNIVELPLAEDLSKSGTFQHYKIWLAGLVERINSLLHPHLPGRWVRIDSHQVPKSYFQHLIFSLKAQVNSVQRKPHRGQPRYRVVTHRISYKIYDLDTVLDALEKQDLVAVKDEALFSGDREPLEGLQDLTAAEAINEAKMQASIPVNQRKRASSKSSLVVGYGEGRATRELEVIWWPDLYTFTDYGRLVIRMFVEKCKF